MTDATAPRRFPRLPLVRRRVAVIAHRGGAAVAPENTLAAIRGAIALGCDYVEVDVRPTRDGHLVLMHDRTVDRTTNGAGSITDLDYGAVQGLDAGSHFSPAYATERVPTFEDALRLARDNIYVYVDHKDGAVEEVWATIQQYGMARHVAVYSNIKGCRAWKRHDPDIPIMPSVPREYRRPGGLRAFHQELPAEILDGGINSWTKSMVDEAHELGVAVHVDNLGDTDNPEMFRHAIDIGVDGIQTDRPHQLIALLASMGL